MADAAVERFRQDRAVCDARRGRGYFPVRRGARDGNPARPRRRDDTGDACASALALEYAQSGISRAQAALSRPAAHECHGACADRPSRLTQRLGAIDDGSGFAKNRVEHRLERRLCCRDRN